MADSVVTGHGAERCFVKDLGDEAHVLVYVDALAVAGCDTCGFLAAVLKRVQAVVG